VFPLSFSAFPFDPRVAAGITACGYDTPMPIQAQAIPPALAGRDVLGLAQTGTGKTAAYALPILNRLVGGPRGALRTLVLAPTRELAEQIRGAFHDLGARTRLRTSAIYGGVGMGRQVDALRRGTDIVVACPGRLLDHIRQRTIDLRRLEVLVLDEADMMLDMGFLPDVRRILEHVPARRQSLLFSATMPAEIRSLAGELLRDPATLKIRHSAPAETVSHAFYPVAAHHKTALLFEILSRTPTGSVLVFTRTKHRAKRLGEQLAREGHRAASLQGNLSQAARQAALNGFREGRYRILVATDIAARGIDVSRVSQVINFDMPATADAYTHRIGRTGRAGRSGAALTLVTREDAAMVREIERVLGSPVERRHLNGLDASQCAATAAAPEAAARPVPVSRSARSSASAGHERSRAFMHPDSNPLMTTRRPSPGRIPRRASTGEPPQEQRRACADVPRDRPAQSPHAPARTPKPHGHLASRRRPHEQTDNRQTLPSPPCGDSHHAQTLHAIRQPRNPRGLAPTGGGFHRTDAPASVRGFKGKVYSARAPYESRPPRGSSRSGPDGGGGNTGRGKDNYKD
jgi:ATP-dependent RNA helicase RhlE